MNVTSDTVSVVCRNITSDNEPMRLVTKNCPPNEDPATFQPACDNGLCNQAKTSIK